METKPLGSTTIAPSVINTIARLTTLATPGVSRMTPTVVLNHIPAARQEFEGVKVQVEDGKIFVDLFVVIGSSENVKLVAEAVQKRVERAIVEMVGMEVAKIDVHITDIDIEA